MFYFKLIFVQHCACSCHAAIVLCYPQPSGKLYDTKWPSIDGMGKELLEPCLWHAVDCRSICFCLLSSSCKRVIAPLYIWGTPSTSCGPGRAVNQSAPDSPPYSELDTWPRLANQNATSLCTQGWNQGMGPWPQLSQSPLPGFSQLYLEEWELVLYFPLAWRGVAGSHLSGQHREGLSAMWENEARQKWELETKRHRGQVLRLWLSLFPGATPAFLALGTGEFPSWCISVICSKKSPD